MAERCTFCNFIVSAKAIRENDSTYCSLLCQELHKGARALEKSINHICHPVHEESPP